jgi:hypothetical protein
VKDIMMRLKVGQQYYSSALQCEQLTIYKTECSSCISVKAHDSSPAAYCMQDCYKHVSLREMCVKTSV